MTSALATLTDTPADRDLLRDLLDDHRGGDQAVTLRQVAAHFGWGRRRAEKAWEDLREACGQYCADGRGIYRAASREDLLRYRLSRLRRLESEKATIRAIDREIADWPEQLSLLD